MVEPPTDFQAPTDRPWAAPLKKSARGPKLVAAKPRTLPGEAGSKVDQSTPSCRSFSSLISRISISTRTWSRTMSSFSVISEITSNSEGGATITRALVLASGVI